MDPIPEQKENFQQLVNRFISVDKFEDLNKFLLGCIGNKAKSLCGQNPTYSDKIAIGDEIVGVLLDVNKVIKDYRDVSSETKLDKLVRLFVLLLDLYILFKNEKLDMATTSYIALETNLNELKHQVQTDNPKFPLVHYICGALTLIQPNHQKISNIGDCLVKALSTGAGIATGDTSPIEPFLQSLIVVIQDTKKDRWFDNLFLFKYVSLLASAEKDCKIYSKINDNYYTSWIDPKKHTNKPSFYGNNYIYTHSTIFEMTSNQDIKTYIQSIIQNYYNDCMEKINPISKDKLDSNLSELNQAPKNIVDFENLVKLNILHSENFLKKLKKGAQSIKPTLSGPNDDEEDEEERFKLLELKATEEIKMLESHISALQSLLH